MLILNAANQPLNQQNGTIPDVSGALFDWFQPMNFTQVTKTVVGFQAVETPVTVNFQGVIQPFTARQLLLKPEGERAWSWYDLYAQYTLVLQVDDVIVWQGRQARVMSRRNYFIYGIVHYELVQDWSGALPTP